MWANYLKVWLFSWYSSRQGGQDISTITAIPKGFSKKSGVCPNQLSGCYNISREQIYQSIQSWFAHLARADSWRIRQAILTEADDWLHPPGDDYIKDPMYY